MTAPRSLSEKELAEMLKHAKESTPTRAEYLLRQVFYDRVTTLSETVEDFVREANPSLHREVYQFLEVREHRGSPTDVPLLVADLRAAREAVDDLLICINLGRGHARMDMFGNWLCEHISSARAQLPPEE